MFKGHVEVNISNGSGIRDPQSGSLRIEVMRTDRRQSLYMCLSILLGALSFSRLVN